MRRLFVISAASVFLCSMSYAQEQQTSAQDSPPPAPTLSLGEIARQVKLKKQQREAQLKAKESGESGRAGLRSNTGRADDQDGSPRYQRRCTRARHCDSGFDASNQFRPDGFPA